MDKKDKVLLLLAPVALVAGGYLLFGDRFASKEQLVPEVENFTSIEAPITEIREKRTNIYRDKYEEENGEKLERNIQSDDSFFGSEVKTDSTVNEVSVNNTQVVKVAKVTADKPEAKPKVIVKYIERPENKQEKEEQVTTNLSPETKTLRRRIGFVEGDAINKNDESTSVLDEVNIATVVQDDVEVKQGSIITLRTTEETAVNGIKIPKNTLIRGVVSLGQQRLGIDVSAIKTPEKTIAVKLKGYDLDGNEGLLLEGGIDKEIKRDVVNDAIMASRQVVRVPILSNSPARVGQKKINDPVVPVQKGYKFILKQ